MPPGTIRALVRALLLEDSSASAKTHPRKLESGRDLILVLYFPGLTHQVISDIA